MGKGFRKRRKQLRLNLGPAAKGPCFKKGCTQNGSAVHTCITCERLVAEANNTHQTVSEKNTTMTDGNQPTIFSVQACQLHDEQALKIVKRHAVTAHPSNLLAVIAAGLKGEKI